MATVKINNGQKTEGTSQCQRLSDVHIRRVCTSDLDACARIETICFHGHGASRERIGLRIQHYREGFQVAVLQKKVVGFINCGCILGDDISDEKLKELEGHNPCGKTRVVFSLAVDPQFQGLGIGSLLMERFITDSREIGIFSILLICREKLIPFYQHFGFVYRQPSGATYGGHQWHEMVLTLA